MTGMGMKQQKTMTRMLKTITVTHKNTFCPQWSPPPPTRAAPVATYVTGFHSAAHAVSPPRVHRPPDPSGPMTLPVVPASRRRWRHRITAIPSRVRRSGETVSSSRRLTHCVWLVSCLIASCEFVVWLPLVSCLIAACELLISLLMMSCLFDWRLWIVWLALMSCLFDWRLWVVCLPFTSCLSHWNLWIVWSLQPVSHLQLAF